LSYGGHCDDLRKLFIVFPKLTELAFNYYEIGDNIPNYSFKNGGDKELLQLKYLRTVTIYNDNTFQGSDEIHAEDKKFGKRFAKRCPGINLRWNPPLDDEADQEEDNDGEDEDDDKEE
ncbi:unnamed protein product, partial [Didymodactylos carnosus]